MNAINDEEKRNVVTALIKEIEIYRNDESEFSGVQGWWEVTELLWDKGNTVEWITLHGKLTLRNKYYILWLVFDNFIIVLVIREVI